MAEDEPIEQKVTNFYRQSRGRFTGPIPSLDPTRHRTSRGSGFRQVAAAGAIAIFILAVAGGAYFVRQNQVRGQSVTSPSPQLSATAAPTLATPTGPFAVFVGTSPSGSSSNYVISLVGANGHTVASATAARRTNSTGTALPEVSTSATRVYYLDGDSQIRSLTPDGKTAAVIKLDASDKVHAAFAVSPDDGRIAVALIDYSAAPPARHLYVSDLNGSNRSEVSVSGQNYVWPVGWHADKLILAVGDATPVAHPMPGEVHPWCDPSTGPCTADNPYAATHGFYLVDPKDSTRLATLASDQCKAMGLMTRAGTLCWESEFPGGRITPTIECRPQLTICLRLADWTGAFTEWSTIATVWIGVLSPSANQMAACCSVDAINVYEARAAGGSVTRLRYSAAPVGWVDDYTLIVQPFGSQNMTMFSLTGRVETPIDAPGIPVALLPGGF